MKQLETLSISDFILQIMYTMWHIYVRLIWNISICTQH